LPRFPLAGCNSKTGCAIILGGSDNDEDVEDFDADREDALGASRKLKVMLDEELITQAEYEAKKKEGEIVGEARKKPGFSQSWFRQNFSKTRLSQNSVSYSQRRLDIIAPSSRLMPAVEHPLR
jgi:hypothetical protein